jgi:guanosine-3',5'-bis(diphosphate) 3'-pyrophosphohydrolase
MYFHDLETFEDWEANVSVLEVKTGHLSEKVTKALEIEKKYHDQPRMFTQGNYNRHPLRVARILVEELHILDETSVLIALCHDLGEWSEYLIEDLKDEFGQEVYEGVRVLTWDQKGEWADFVASIVNSNIKNLIAIKIADKLDNNRATALSGSTEEKEKARNKTTSTILPLVVKHYPNILETYNEVLSRLI